MLVVLFVVDALSKLVVNPLSLFEEPTSSDALSVVDRNTSRSISFFSIGLLVIQLALPDSLESSITGMQLLSIYLLTFSTGLLILSFNLELWAPVSSYCFNLQLTSVRFSGLLLFSGLVAFVDSLGTLPVVTNTLGGFVALGGLLWLIHEIDYILISERREWNQHSALSRTEWLKLKLDWKTE